MAEQLYDYLVEDPNPRGHSSSKEELEDVLDRAGRAGWLLVTEHANRLIFVRPRGSSTRQAVTGTVSVVIADNQGDPNMGQLTVDSQGNAKYQFDDDHKDVVGPPKGDGSGIVVTFASDNSAVASLANPVGIEGTDANGLPEYLAPLTFGTDGTFNLSAVVTNVSGAPLVDDDGATPFVQAAPVSVPVAGGQAVTGTASAG